MVGGVIHVYVEVAGDEEFMRCGCRSGEKRCEFIHPYMHDATGFTLALDVVLVRHIVCA